HHRRSKSVEAAGKAMASMVVLPGGAGERRGNLSCYNWNHGSGSARIRNQASVCQGRILSAIEEHPSRPQRADARRNRERVLAEEMSAAIPASTVSVKQALHEAVGDLMSKAQAAGAIRSDIGPGDVTMLLSAISHATAHTDPDLRERYLSIVLDGLRPHDAS